MKTSFGCIDYATNAACPQRPAWQITPVGYKWAESVFQGWNPHYVLNAKKELKLRQCWRVFGRMVFFLKRRQITKMEKLICNMSNLVIQD